MVVLWNYGSSDFVCCGWKGKVKKKAQDIKRRSLTNRDRKSGLWVLFK